jgi:hypothetical protein
MISNDLNKYSYNHDNNLLKIFNLTHNHNLSKHEKLNQKDSQLNDVFNILNNKNIDENPLNQLKNLLDNDSFQKLLSLDHSQTNFVNSGNLNDKESQKINNEHHKF